MLVVFCGREGLLALGPLPPGCVFFLLFKVTMRPVVRSLRLRVHNDERGDLLFLLESGQARHDAAPIRYPHPSLPAPQSAPYPPLPLPRQLHLYIPAPDGTYLRGRDNMFSVIVRVPLFGRVVVLPYSRSRKTTHLASRFTRA